VCESLTVLTIDYKMYIIDYKMYMVEIYDGRSFFIKDRSKVGKMLSFFTLFYD